MMSEARRLDHRVSVNEVQLKLSHRGPDDRGVCSLNQGRLVFAHTRLSILDLSFNGHQPMCDQLTGNWIVFNGEIYNYKELRKELAAESREQGARGQGQSAKGKEQGARSGERDEQSTVSKAQSAEKSAVTGPRSPVSDDVWHSNSDTEVILRAYAKWGTECVTRLRGMFAFAIWDDHRQELFLARDSFGIKPLYFYQTSERFLFASELRALLASDLVPRKLSQDGLASYLQFGSCQDPLTIVENVHSLLPGHCLTVKRAGNCLEIKEFPFGQTPNTQPPRPKSIPKSRKEAVAELRTILEDSVRHHLVSDVPVAAFLSGGIDSGAIVALMSQVAGQRAQTYSVVFEESEFSEGEYAKLVSRKFGTEHHEIMLSEPSLIDMLPRALEAMDQPTMDGVNTYVVSKAVRDEGVKVALSGLGGDELFAGYPSFRRARQLRRLAIMPSAIRQATLTLGRSCLNGSARNRKFWDLVDSDCSPRAAYALSRQLFSPSEISALMVRDQRPKVRDQLGEYGAFSWSGSVLHAPGSMHDPINAVSRYELQGYMANTLLRDTDQMSMAHALEVRVPFVDSVVVDFVLGLPGEWKVDGNRPKPLLLDALGDLLPEEIWKRRKMGFTLPFQRWLRAGLKSEIGQVLLDKNGIERLGLNGDETREIWEAFKNNPEQEPWSRPWALYVLKQWCERNGVTA